MPNPQGSRAWSEYHRKIALDESVQERIDALYEENHQEYLDLFDELKIGINDQEAVLQCVGYE